jgi:type VI secretion system secreted protein VgrG
MQAPPVPTFHFEADSLPPEVQVLSFRGRERVGHPYAFDVVIAVPWGLSPEAAAAALVDRRLVLALADHPDARRIAGFAERLTFQGALARERYALKVRLVPGLALLRRRRTSRVFQELTVPEIIARVVGLARLPLRRALTREYASREYCVQYRETDLDFILRLTREEGLVLTFDDPAPGANEEVIVLSDGSAPHGPIHGDPELAVREVSPDQAMARREHDVHEVRVERRGASRSLLVQTYDPMRPRARVASGAATDTVPAYGAGETRATDKLPLPDDADLVYEHDSDYETIDVERGSAEVRLAQERRKTLRISGASRCARLAVGRSFVLADQELSSAPRELCFVTIDHEGKGHELAGGGPVYTNRFRAIPADVIPRPRAARRAPTQVAETAVVVGPRGHEVHTDKHGRVKIQFHWDLDGHRDEHSSCWIRVAQAWAGEAFGALFMPRVGMEVLVTFLGGDVDRPVVTGALYHAAHPPPFGLPAGALTSGIVTRSVPGGGGQHELSFHDTRGKELIRVSSERDLELTAKNDSRLHVTMNRSDTVGQDDFLKVDGARHVHVGGADAREVHGPADDSFYGDRVTLVMGKTTGHAQGPVNLTLGSGGVITSNGSLSTQVRGDFSLVVGTGGSLAQTSIDGRYVLGASQTVAIRAEQSLLLQVGSTTLELTPEGMKLNGKALSLKGESIVAEGKGPRLTLGEEAELVSQKIGIFSKSAALELEDDAELWGKSVKFSKPKTAPEKKSKDDETKKKPFKLKVSDATMEPYADKHFELFADGVRLAGSTGGDGDIDVEIPDTATRVDVTLWVDEYPTGRKKVWSVRVAELPPATTPRGALMRLHNLGYYTGAPIDVLGNGEKAALRWFQKDHDLEETGELDAPTSGELEHVHGS